MRRFAIIAAVASMLVFAGVTDGWHYQILIEDAVKNPDGATLRGIQSSWIISGNSYGIWSERNPLPAAIGLAIDDWEQVLPGVQFDAARVCTPNAINIRFATVSGDLCPDIPPFKTLGCADSMLQPDAQRSGSYAASGSFIWIDDIPLGDGRQPYTDDVLRALAAHELGHLFGLHEAYDDVSGTDLPPTQSPCVDGPDLTIMNAFVDADSDGKFDGSCDGVLGPDGSRLCACAGPIQPLAARLCHSDAGRRARYECSVP